MGLELAYAPIFKDGDLHADIVARVGGEPIVRAKVNLSSERSRMRFRTSLLAVDASLNSREIDVELLRIADGVQMERARRLAQTKVERAQKALWSQFSGSRRPEVERPDVSARSEQ